MEWIFHLWTLTFWIPAVASAVMCCCAVARGSIAQPLRPVLWLLGALLLQYAWAPLTIAWVVGLVAQSALAIYLTIRVKLEV